MFVQKTLKLPVAHVIAAKLLGVEPLHLLFFLLLSPWLGKVYIFLAIPMQSMALPVVEFARQGYKIGKVFA